MEQRKEHKIKGFNRKIENRKGNGITNHQNRCSPKHSVFIENHKSIKRHKINQKEQMKHYIQDIQKEEKTTKLETVVKP